MKKILIGLVLLSGLTACSNSSKDIEGTWVAEISPYSQETIIIEDGKIEKTLNAQVFGNITETITADFVVKEKSENLYTLELENIESAFNAESMDATSIESGFLQKVIDLENDPYVILKLYKEEQKIHTFSKEGEFLYEYIKQE